MSKLAIIPARGGSKRILRKNIKLFLGKPIIAYSIEAALKSKLFDEVMVSTDDEEIREIALKYGAKVPFLRSETNANDFATTAAVINEVLEVYKTRNKLFKYCICIYPTAPFVSSNLLIKAFKKLKKDKLDAVFSVLKYGFPIQRAMKINKEDKVEMVDVSKMNIRSQDLESSFHDAGQFYALNVSAFIKKQKLWTNNTGCIEINELEAQDIDTETDWKLAELKYKLFLDEKENSF
ncbi:pseudaminic acid cytidylyltransferase [Polaribacter sp.]|jgi:pseudaminic acid cytidylyltransferase|nr:pseudaminic acid cytidylyltransferase [Polaribacter sp.]|tara:strand:- start:1086 stop:1793 length:708 start_codon:yes stop_codon:yes gene_type:complete